MFTVRKNHKLGTFMNPNQEMYYHKRVKITARPQKIVLMQESSLDVCDRKFKFKVF